MSHIFKVGDAVYLRDEVAGSRVDVFGVRPEELGRLKGVKGTVLSNGTVPNVQFPVNIWCFPIEHLLPAAAYEASGGGAHGDVAEAMKAFSVQGMLENKFATAEFWRIHGVHVARALSASREREEWLRGALVAVDNYLKGVMEYEHGLISLDDPPGDQTCAKLVRALLRGTTGVGG